MQLSFKKHCEMFNMAVFTLATVVRALEGTAGCVRDKLLTAYILNTVVQWSACDDKIQ